MKQLNCGDLISGCDHVVRGYTDNEVLRKAAEHGLKDHNIQAFTKDFEVKAARAISDIPDEGKIDSREDTHGT
jgi:predicted small metal-binding protein